MGIADSRGGRGHQHCTPALPGLGFHGWERGGGNESSAVGVKHEEGVEQPREIKELRK